MLFVPPDDILTSREVSDTTKTGSDHVAEDNQNVAEIEKTNEAVTRAFTAAWSNRSCDELLPLLAENITYVLYEGGPTYVGPVAVEGAVRPFLAKFERVEFEILRLNVIGPLVIHERTEHFYAPGGELDTRFHVVGMLLIRDGKIEDWRDYAIPGVKQIVGPLIRPT
jgi:limonene-1,2-epoxide hydrolase